MMPDLICPNGQHWYAVQTKPRNEYLVRDMLEHRAIAAYLPVLPLARKRASRGRVDKPFFSRYLFAHVDLNHVPLSSINWAPGVTRVVGFGGEPAPVPETVIAWLRERLGQINAEDYHQGLPLRPGDRLRVTDGPLKDMEAIFDQRLSSGDRARVFIEVLGRLTACQIDLSDLERA
jgi:transcriptional antiterminator RfaH